MRRGRVRLLLVAVVAAVAVVGALTVIGLRAPTPGPLQPTGDVNSFGFYATDESTVTLIVQYRAEQSATAVLHALSLREPDPGLQVVDAGILTSDFEGAYHSRSFPPGDMTGVDGYVLETVPGPRGDVFFVLGVRVDLSESPQRVRGIWLEYSVDSTRHKALLPWLFTICRDPVAGPCVGLGQEDFEWPITR